MPIAFPRPTGHEPLYRKQLWMNLSAKAFDVVPAPSFGNIGATLSTYRLGDDTAVAVNKQKATNVRNLGTMYQAPDQYARVNPANALWNAQLDDTKTYNRVLGAQNERIIGVSRDATGAPLGGCDVNVFRTVDDVLVASTTSNGSGGWTAYPNQPGPYFFVEYKAGAPDVFGTSPNTNTSTQFTPGQ